MMIIWVEHQSEKLHKIIVSYLPTPAQKTLDVLEYDHSLFAGINLRYRR